LVLSIPVQESEHEPESKNTITKTIVATELTVAKEIVMQIKKQDQETKNINYTPLVFES